VEAETKHFKHTDNQDALRMYAENEWQNIAPNIPDDYYPRKISVRWTNLCNKIDIIEPLFDLDCVGKYQSIYDIPDRITFGDPKRIFNN
jgi:hypothetical protein